MAENQTLQRLIQELEYLVQLSSHHVLISKERIFVAKDVMNVPSSQFTNRNEPRQSSDIPCKVRDVEAHNSFEENLLGEEITRILQVAENVREKAMAKGNQKSKVSSIADSIVTRTNKVPAPSSRFHSTSVRSEKKTLMKSDRKTVYQKDYSLVKSKSMPSLLGSSKGNEILKGKTLGRNSYQQDKKMGSEQSKAVGRNSGQCSPRRNKDFIKMNKQNIALAKKETPRNTISSKRVPEASRLFQCSKVNDSYLCDELALRTQLPKNNDILMLLRDIHHFLAGSNRKAGKKEVALKENFIERCSSSVPRGGLGPEQCSILEILLPHCRWAFGRDEIMTVNDLSNLKDTISGLEEKLSTLNHLNLSQNEKYVKKALSDVINVQHYSEIQESTSLLVLPFWHPLVMSSVLQGVELPPFLYYNNVREWISFQNAVLELHEYYIQLKILENILPLLAEVLAVKDSDDYNAEDNDEDWNTTLAKLLKTAAILADFTGHLTVPILASIKPDDESAADSS